MERVVEDLIVSAGDFGDVSARHTLMGLCTDDSVSVYVVVLAGQLVKRITPEGEESIVARSPKGWSPTRGWVGTDSDLWLLAQLPDA